MRFALSRRKMKLPVTLIRITCSNSSVVVSSKGLFNCHAASLTRISSRPKRLSTLSSTARICFSSETSQRTNDTLADAPASSVPLFSSISATITCAPSFDRRRTTAAPIPLAPPVTTATFPCNEASIIRSFHSELCPYNLAWIPPDGNSGEMPRLPERTFFVFFIIYTCNYHLHV